MKDKLLLFISNRFVKHILIMLVISIVAFISLNHWLSSYTAHGETKEVPNFVGLDMQSAIQLAKENSFILKIQDTVFSEKERPGNIVDHTPKSGSLVKENRTIWIYINSTEPILVSMPKAFDVSLRQAQHILKHNGLQIGRVEYKPDVADNYVLEQKYNGNTIEIGSKIPKGAKISLVVGKGSLDTKIKVPSLIGKTYENACILLDSLGVNYNPIYTEAGYKNKQDSLKATVWKQNPNSTENSLMMLSQTLDFWVKPKNHEITELND